MAQVENIYDACEKLFGQRLRFESTRGGKAMLPTKSGMEKILGVLTFLCLILEGRVKPEGEFKNVLLEQDKEGQTVDFNIPMLAGVVDSTLARSFEQKQNSILIDAKRSENRHNKFPVVLGVDKEDEEIWKIIAKTL